VGGAAVALIAGAAVAVAVPGALGAFGDRVEQSIGTAAAHVPGGDRVLEELRRTGVAADGSPAAAAPDLAPRTLTDPRIAELSGLAASRLHPGVLYGINDSGNPAVVFELAADGSTAGVLQVQGADNIDWEALAPGTGADGAPALWIGDIGDNGELRRSITVYRIPEPTALGDATVAAESFDLRYPDGPHNAEALVVDPGDGALLVVTKADGAEGRIYRAPLVLRQDRANALELVGTAPPMITDGAWEAGVSTAPRLVLTDYWRIHRQAPDGTWVSGLGPLQLGREALAWPWPATGAPEVLVGGEGTGSQVLPADVP
jgi:hypothetical protein